MHLADVNFYSIELKQLLSPMSLMLIAIHIPVPLPIVRCTKSLLFEVLLLEFKLMLVALNILNSLDCRES
jgi:hypothetical protein